MKKFFTLALMAFSFCLTTAADVVLGDIKFSLAEGKKISPTTGKILVTFPSVEGVDIATTKFSISGIFDAPGEENDVDFELEETFAHGITFDLKDFELQASTEYALRITSVVVNEVDLAPEGGFVLNFKTRGAERKMSWTFVIDSLSSAMIMKEGKENTETDLTKYLSVGSKNRWYVPSTNYEEILLPDGTPLPMTEELLFKFGSKSFYVGEYNTGDYKDRICFNNNNQMLVIPDCQEGDVITLRALRSSKSNTYIQAMNGCALAPDGQTSKVSGLKDSIPMGSGLANHRFEVQIAGDVTFKIGNTLMTAINIEEAQPKLPRNYKVVAAYTENDNQTELKELVPLTEGTTGSSIKVNYPYWLTDKNNVAYTHGSKGSEFAEVFDLKNGLGDAPYADTTFVINYTKTDFENVVYLSEAEDIEGTTLCIHDNVAIRSSMAKAAYPAEGDIKLVTLQPGSYKIRAVLFDGNKTPGYTCILSKGEQPEDDIWLSASSTNFDEKESPLITLTEETDITWIKQDEGNSKGLDCIMIYQSEDAPEDPMAVSEVKAAKPTVARKLMKNGQILINTEAGTFNVMGIQVR